MVSLAFLTSSSPRIPTPVGVWQGAREDSWTPTEFSLALLEPSLTPPPLLLKLLEEEKKPCQISEPASGPLNIAR